MAALSTAPVTSPAAGALQHVACTMRRTRSSCLVWQRQQQHTTGLLVRIVLAVNLGVLLGLTAFVAVTLWGPSACPATSSQPAPQSNKTGAYLAMCLIVKDQNNDLREWIAYHHALGAGRFYVYDHASAVPAIADISDHVDSGLVQYRYFIQHDSSTHQYAQSWVYDQCLQQGKEHQFIAFIDTDEFLVFTDKSIPLDLPAYLRQFEPYGGLVVNWRLFGSSGFVKRPAGGTLGNFWACAPVTDPQQTHVKTIANTKHALHSGSDPHHFLYSGPTYAVNELFERVDGARTEAPSFEHIALHHYAVKSLEDFQAKIQRGQAHGEIGKTIEFFTDVEQRTTQSCEDALQFGRQFGTPW